MCERIRDDSDDVGRGFAHQITRLCYEHYKRRLSKNGKPQKNCEWTLLAAVVQSVHSDEGIVIVKLFVSIFVLVLDSNNIHQQSAKVSDRHRHYSCGRPK